MKTFLKKSLFFIIPFIALIPVAEFYLRNNSFKAKADYMESNRDSIEILIFGSSRMWRGIYPDSLNYNVASLALGGSAINIDHKFFYKYIDKLPELKLVIFELSYHFLEVYRSETWVKNHLLHLYFDINNYIGEPPFKDNFLLTSNPREYFEKLFAFKYHDDHGFIKYDNEFAGTYALLDFDTALIRNRYIKDANKNWHTRENINRHKKNCSLVVEMLKTCERKNIKVLFLSPPKYYIYFENMNMGKLKRRNDFIKKILKKDEVYFWDYDTLFPYDPKRFIDEHHMNFYGAKEFSHLLYKRLKTILKSEDQLLSF